MQKTDFVKFLGYDLGRNVLQAWFFFEILNTGYVLSKFNISIYFQKLIQKQNSEKHLFFLYVVIIRKITNSLFTGRWQPCAAGLKEWGLSYSQQFPWFWTLSNEQIAITKSQDTEHFRYLDKISLLK